MRKKLLTVIVLILLWGFGVLSALLAPLSLLVWNTKYRRWPKNNFTWLDQGINSFFLFGDPDETISSRCGKRLVTMDCVPCTWLCRILDWADKGHCEKAVDLGEGKNEVKVGS